MSWFQFVIFYIHTFISYHQISWFQFVIFYIHTFISYHQISWFQFVWVYETDHRKEVRLKETGSVSLKQKLRLHSNWSTCSPYSASFGASPFCSVGRKVSVQI